MVSLYITVNTLTICIDRKDRLQIQLVIPRSLAAGTEQPRMKGWKKDESRKVVTARGKYNIA